MEGISFAEIDSTLFSDAFTRLEHISLENSFGYCASDDQIKALLTKIMDRNSTKLKSLCLTLVNLSHMDTSFLHSLLTSNIKIKLRDCTLNEAQLSNLSESRMEVEVLDKIGGKIIINYPSSYQRQVDIN